MGAPRTPNSRCLECQRQHRGTNRQRYGERHSSGVDRCGATRRPAPSAEGPARGEAIPQPHVGKCDAGVAFPHRQLRRCDGRNPTSANVTLALHFHIPSCPRRQPQPVSSSAVVIARRRPYLIGTRRSCSHHGGPNRRQARDPTSPQAGRGKAARPSLMLAPMRVARPGNGQVVLHDSTIDK